MKKLLKSRLFFFILGALVFSISAVFAYSYFAQGVGFVPSDTSWNVDNIKDALDELKEKIKWSRPATIYSAAYDEIYYYDEGEKVILAVTDSTGKSANAIIPDVASLTIYSSVAKDINDNTSPYSKTITNKENDIYLMPAKTLYWYGNLCSDMLLGGIEAGTSENGWTAYYRQSGIGYSIQAPVFNIHSVVSNPSGGVNASGIGTSRVISSDNNIHHLITKNVTDGWFCSDSTKNIMGNDTGDCYQLTANTNRSYTMPASDAYVHIHSDNSRVFEIAAWWVE